MKTKMHTVLGALMMHRFTVCVYVRATVFMCISFDPLQLVLTLICSAKNLNEIENENEIDLVSVSLLLPTIVYGGRARTFNSDFQVCRF